MEHIKHQAEVWQQTVLIPTYAIGQPNRNPMFLENRVYQGSSGKVYPLPVVDAISDEKRDEPWQAVFLENDYIRVMVLPELGGRIQRALDKTNNYDFVYYNEVIKPALVGLTGPWISGGIEFNWPQHHRPTTFAPVDWRLCEHADGSRSVELSEVDRMYGTKCVMTITLHPDAAYIEIKGRLYNPTDLPQTFLWWANPAFAVNDSTRSVFPPDVTAVFDHGKRDVSRFPIADGVYYKHDYGAGVDISRYKNIPVPTSYMCAHSDYDFVGGYDEGKRAGLLHVADHRISPGKKQWTWGCGDFGKAWDLNLTDANGPYVELMTGVYCDNQPDFTWLAPYEEKTFTQYFMPYKDIDNVCNATRDAAVGLRVDNGSAELSAYVTSPQKAARITLTSDGRELYGTTVDLSPLSAFAAKVDDATGILRLTISDKDGHTLVSYSPKPKRIERIPDPMPPAKPPEELNTVEELYLTGLHIEQYRHATYLPDAYYCEGLRRDPGDVRANNAYGRLLMRRGQYARAEACFNTAIARLTEHNPNPCDCEAYLNLGLCLLKQERVDEAYDALYKATWAEAQQAAAFYALACIDCRRQDYEAALEHVESGLARSAHSGKALALRGMILVSLGRHDEARTRLSQAVQLDAFNYAAMLALGDTATALRRMGGREQSFIDAALQMAEAGYYEAAINALMLCSAPKPMNLYHRAHIMHRLNRTAGDIAACLRTAAEADPLYCFPNKLEDIAALSFAMEAAPADARAPYYLGCLWYDKRQYDKAIACWEQSASLDASYPTVWRNLAIAYYNKLGEPKRALDALERAYLLDESDARVLLELDQLHKRLNMPPEQRFAFLDSHRATALTRDDLTVEYITLLNLLSRHDEALQMLMSRRFHPWEGGEGKVTKQYAVALIELGRRALRLGDVARAAELFTKALTYPDNLGEGKLEGAKDNDIHYLLGIALRRLGNEESARRELELAACGEGDPSNALYYNDQPADLILYQGLAHRALGREERARSRLNRLVSYGEKHYYDTVRMDYFAVSLPDLQLFDEDLSLRNRAHCEYLIALGSYGLGDMARAERCFASALAIDASLEGALIHAALMRDNSEGC